MMVGTFPEFAKTFPEFAKTFPEFAKTFPEFVDIPRVGVHSPSSRTRNNGQLAHRGR